MTHQPATQEAEHQWKQFANKVCGDYAPFFDGVGPITGARAPGRLDVMGGIADYSGSTVLEATLSDATYVAVQSRDDGILKLRSLGIQSEGLREEVTLPLHALIGSWMTMPFVQTVSILREPVENRWTGYVAGCLYVLVASGWLDRKTITGLNIWVESTVPIGVGVSSSAALEVATMSALCGHFGIHMDGLELARLCQVVENRVVGAPCGIMDQVTSALGCEGRMVVLKCQPHQILGHQPIPPHWRLVGLDSGVKHAVSGRSYARARVAAFMGLKILQTAFGQDLDGYLCNLSPGVWHSLRESIPERLTGREFLSRYGTLPDSVTTVDPEETYSIRACTEHPILENSRVREFIALTNLAAKDPDRVLLREAGALMLASHESYSQRVDLGSSETDLLVDLVMERGPVRGLYGAKITGGGSGGTVAVLCAGPRADVALAEVRKEYQKQVGVYPRMFQGSSPGAMAFRPRRIG
jgi:L-arabinokinase